MSRKHRDGEHDDRSTTNCEMPLIGLLAQYKSYHTPLATSAYHISNMAWVSTKQFKLPVN